MNKDVKYKPNFAGNAEGPQVGAGSPYRSVTKMRNHDHL